MKNMRVQILAIIILTIMAGCSDTIQDLESNTKNIPSETNMRVNYYTVDCIGESHGKCLLIQEGNNIGTEQWNYFYFKDDINGFSFESGYLYNLLVQKNTLSNPPQDASSIQYDLIKILSKEKQD